MSTKKTNPATASTGKATIAQMQKKATQLASYIGKQLQLAAKAPPGTVKITFSVKTSPKQAPSGKMDMVHQPRGKFPINSRADTIVHFPPGLPGMEERA